MNTGFVSDQAICLGAMAFKVSDDDMLETIKSGHGGIKILNDWVRDGLDLSMWRGYGGRNVFHYCARLASSDLIQSITTLCPSYKSLLTQTDDSGFTPLQLCCNFGFGVGYNGYLISRIESLIRIDPSQFIDQYDRCFPKTDESPDNTYIIPYLKWRKENALGLPDFIAKQKNDVILKYIKDVPDSIKKEDTEFILKFIYSLQAMTESEQIRYRRYMTKKCGKSRNIRVYYVGHEGVGKSTLCRIMLDMGIDEVKSTDLMETFIQRKAVNLRTGARRDVTDGTEYTLALEKIKREMAAAIATEPYWDTIKTKFEEFKRRIWPTAQDDQASLPHSRLEEPEDLWYSSTFPQQYRTTLAAAEGASSVIREQDRESKILSSVAMMKMADDKLSASDEEAYVSLWDFGGEEIFLNTNHLFLSKDAVYLLVFRLDECKERNSSNQNRVQLWLKSIDSFSSDRNRKNAQPPPVIMIGTFLDKLPGRTQAEKLHHANEIYKSIVKSKGLEAIVKRHVVAFFPIDNTERKHSMPEKIWTAILHAAPLQSHWQTPVPLAWLALEREIMFLKRKNIKVAKLQDIIDIAKGLEVDIADIETSVRDFLSHLHRTGVILSFLTTNQNCKVILNPQWLANAFRLIITSKKFKKDIPEISNEVDHYYETGQISLEAVHTLWNQDEDFKDHEKVLILYMERLKLLTCPLTKDGKVAEQLLFVPCLLPDATPEVLKPIFENPNTTNSATLSFRFQFSDAIISSPIYDKLLASCIQWFAVAELSGLQQSLCLQKGFGCFQLNPCWNMVLHCTQNVVKITLFSEEQRVLEPGEGFHLKHIIHTLLNNILEMHQQYSLVNAFVFCLDQSYEVRQSGKSVKASELSHSTKQIPCIGLAGKSTVKKQDWDVWFHDPQNQTSYLSTDQQVQEANKEQEIPVSLELNESEIMDRIPTTRELSHVAKCIGSSYCILFITLGLTMEEIEHVQETHRGTCFRTVLTYLLRRWKNKKGERFKQIYKAMEDMSFRTNSLFHCEDTDVQDEDAKRCPTDTDIHCIAEVIGTSYTVFFLELGLEIADIERGMLTYRSDIKSAYTGLLHLWKEKFTSKATLYWIYKAMREADMDVENLRKRLSKKEK